jgi:SAM-dependent methyltransferase
VTETDASYWQHLSERYRGAQRWDPALAEHARQVNLELIRRWAPTLKVQRVLKTDAFAEATCPARAYSWHVHENAQLVNIDIAPGLSLKGRLNATGLGYDNVVYAAADVRFIPFADGSFDLILSDSTLDHFHTTDDIHLALTELARVLRPGGTLVITLDNPKNLTEPLFRLWIRLGKPPFFIGRTLSQEQLVQSLENLGLHVTDTTTMFHYPRFFTKAVLRLMRGVAGSRCDSLARRMLQALDKLGQFETRYLTGLFVAARAVKPS